MSMTRDELIAALEKATGPSRELDEELDRIRNPDEWFMRDCHAPEGNSVWGWDSPHYTASIDAALTLVPDELWRSILHAPNVGKATVSLRTGGLTDPNTKEWMGYACTPAIAICVAALKERGA